MRRFRIFIGSFLSQQLLLVLTLVIALGAILGWYAYFTAKNLVERDAKRTVFMAADSRAQLILTLLKRQQLRGRKLLDEIESVCPTAAAPNRCMRGILQNYQRTEGFEGAVLTTSSGRLLHLGKVFAFPTREKLRPRQFVRFSATDDRLEHLVYTRTKQLQIVLLYDSSALKDIFESGNHLGKSGNAFLVDHSGIVLASMKQEYPSSLQTRQNPPTRACLSGQSARAVAPDYLGQLAVEGYRAIPEIGGGCSLAKMDLDEAFSEISGIRKRILGITAVFCGVALLLGFTIVQSWSVPIFRLTDRARALERGDFDSPVPIKGPTEIQTLARSIATAPEAQKRTILELRQAHEVLEQRVAERTRSLEQANRDLQIFQLLLENVKDYGIILLDPSGKVVSWNIGAERIKGYKAHEIIGKHFSVFYTADDRARNHPQDELTVVLKNGRFEEEAWRIRKDGSRYWANVILTPVYGKNGTLRGFAKITRDMSDRKKIDDALARTRDELAKRNAELIATNQELEAFSYSVSHDLRAPLRAIDGFSQALMEDYAKTLDETGRNYLQRVRSATQRMGTLIDDLLNLSRLTRTPLAEERVDLSQLAQECIEELRKSDPDRRTETIVKEGVVVRGDSGLLRAALQNLFSNAWKFTSKTPDARIEFGVKEANGALTYFVRDNGAGFNMAYSSKLFGAFQRLHKPSEFQGTGIGLATVRRIIHRHGGRIWAESAPGKGAAFYFTLGKSETIKGERAA